ncbi:ligand-binding sensor domain-containing protein [Pontiella sulfatireligans]|uniref:Virginiamycin B lyase n=1 Tax=Pontiella sulfatireligans TaxID=2750658 RepID=A0A6C2UTA4_9BACT|nr:hypothetical protein [Pontiella sulfatireligans]VGO23562.1 hypothetical protein SCARR_05669 [Pontiella sulfatireligans]
MRNGFLKLLALTLALLPLWCAAVVPYTPEIADPMLEPWRWQHVEYLDGAGVLCMDEVPDGTLWFGAVGGLVRDDGQEVTRIPFDEGLLRRISSQRPVPWASAVLVLGKEDLLVVAGKSLVRWHQGEWAVLVKALEPVNFDVRLFQGKDETIWLQMQHALWRINDDLSGGKVVARVPEGCRLSACAGATGDVWLVQSYKDRDDELIHIPVVDGEALPAAEWEYFPAKGSSGLRNVSLLAGRNGRIWFADASGDHGVLYFDVKEEAWRAAASAPHSNSHYSLLESRDGTLWAGGAGEIYSLGARGPSIYLPYQLGLPVVPLYLFESSGGRIWVLTQFGRIYNVDTGSHQWQTYPQLHFQCESADGSIQWFLTKDSHAVSHDLDSGRWLQHEVSDGMISLPRALVCSSHGLVWAAGSHGEAAGIAVFDGKQWKHFLHPEFAEAIAPRAVFEAMDGTMWFGTVRYLKPITKGGALQYGVSADGDVGLLKQHVPPVFPKQVISVFAQQDTDSLWLGGVQTDCYHLTDHRMELITALPWRITDDMAVDAAGVLWVAKGGFGVYRKEGDSWIRYSTEDGVASSLVSDLLPLRDGTLLAASGSGISRFDGRSWTMHAFPPTISMTRNSGTMHQAQDNAVWLNFGERDWQLRTRAPTASLGEHTKFCSVRYVADAAPPDTRITYCLAVCRT